jgi:hypothetical protein
MKLVFHTLNDGVKEFDVDQTSVVVGRGSACDVVLKIDGLSRQHCRIDLDRDGNFIITDLGSTNGVFIDNVRLEPNTPTMYSPYLSLAIGSVPQVTLEAPETPIIIHDTNSADITGPGTKPGKKSKIPKVDLDIPEHKKRQWTRKGRLPEPKVKVVRTIPWAMIVGVTLIALLTIVFFYEDLPFKIQ